MSSQKADKSDGTGKSKGTSEQRPGRLPSLRGPRDLTLGGVRKKTFAPNIPTRKDRVKQDPKNEESSKRPEKRDRSRRDRSRGRGGGRGRGRPEIIQSHSIFEAGPSAESIKKRTDTGYGSVGGGGGGSKDAIEKPTIKKEDYDEEYEKTKSEEALMHLEGGSSFIADLDNDDSLMPTALPMSYSRSIFSVKPDPIKKSEQTKIPAKTPTILPADCASLFSGDDQWSSLDPTNILIFQLPDTLPAVTVSSEAEVKNDPVPQVKQEIDAESKIDDKNCTLDQLSEGFIGKLKVTKSGRCMLVLGGITLDLDVGTPTSFHEEVVSVRLPPEAQAEFSTGHMTVLGDVSHKIVCTPNMEQLIMQGKG